MRPFTARIAVCLGLVLTVAIAGCGGSRVRPDATVDPEPEPEPEPVPPAEADAAAPDSGPTGVTPDAPSRPDASAASPDRPAPSPPSPDAPPDPTDPDGPASADPDTAPPPPPADTAPPDPGPPPDPNQTCGGVTCPGLFGLVNPCRPTGTCTFSALTVPLTFCYANGIKVVGESIVPPNLVGLVKRADGSDCYRARVTQPAGSTQRTVVWETPAGELVASGVFDDAGTGTITCGGATTPLTDPTCVAVPSPQGCIPGVCF